MKKRKTSFFISLIFFWCLGLLVPGTVKADATTYKPTTWNDAITNNGQLANGDILDLTDANLPADAGNTTITVDGKSVTIRGNASKTYNNLSIVIKGGVAVTIENLNIKQL